VVDLRSFVERALGKGISKSELKEELRGKGYSEREINEAFGERSSNQIKQTAASLTYVERVTMLFSKPGQFFSNVREPTMQHSVILYLLVGALSAALGIGLSYIFRFAFGSYGMSTIFSLFGFGGIFSFMYIALYLGIGLVGLLVFALIAFGLARLFGGTGSYVDTFNAVCYGTIPGLILQVIPFIGWLAGGIYALVVSIFGISVYHTLSKGKATFIILLPIIVVFGLLFLLVLWIIFSFRHLVSGF